MPLGLLPNAVGMVGESHIVPSCVKTLSIMDYEVKEDNLWNACQFSVAVILSYRGRWFWETLNLSWERINLTWETLLLKSCFSVDANLLQGILESGLAVDKLEKTIVFYFFNINSNRKPPVGRLVTDIVPPWNITACFTIASPSPVPPNCRERPLSTR